MNYKIFFHLILICFKGQMEYARLIRISSSVGDFYQSWLFHLLFYRRFITDGIRHENKISTRKVIFISWFFFIIFSIPLNSFSIHDPVAIGAKSGGMGNIGVVGTDFYSLHNNQAALAFYDKTTVALDYDQGFFADKNLSTKTLGMALPTGFGTLGLNMKYFGYSDYNEQKIGLAYGKTLGKNFAIGVQLDYLRTFIGGDYGNAQAVTFEIGLYSKLTKKLELGAHVFNPIAMKIGKENAEQIPVGFKLGLLYHVDQNLLMAVEVEKLLNYAAIFKFGAQYNIGNHFVTRVGVATNPTLFTLGFGLRWNKVIMDIGTGYHQNLGLAPRISLLFNFN